MDVSAALHNTTRAQAALHALAALQLTAHLWPPGAHVCDGDSYDYVVVGAGSAGCALAARLAQLLPSTRVLLVEAGGDPPLESVLPGLFMYLPRSEYDWNYTASDAAPYHRGGAIDLTRGRMLGGSSSANYMVYVRGHPRDYAEWAAAAGDAAWDWPAVLPYFLRSEHLEDPAILASPAAALHGTAGPLRVTREPHADIPEYLDAFRETGHAVRLDVSGDGASGYAQPLYTIAGGVRQSSAYAYLRPAPPNLHVLKRTLVTRVLFDARRRAVGVRAQLPAGHAVALRATREVVLTAGALNTPQLLMLSGVGPAGRLRELGVPVVVDLPAVGRGLQDHVSTLLYIKMEESDAPPPPSDDPTRFPGSMFLGFSATYERGPDARPDYETENFALPANDESALRLCAVAFGLRADLCEALHAAGRARRGLLTVLSLLHPRSRGRVALRSADPRAAPSIELGYYSDAADLESMVDYIEDFLRVLNTTHMVRARAELWRPLLRPCANLSGRAYWRCYARHVVLTQYHYAGSAALGAALDARLRVRGVRRLRVADASAMPALPGANTNAPSIMIGEKAADIIKADLARTTRPRG